MTERKRTRTEANREHDELVKAILLAVSSEFGTRCYSDRLRQYRGNVVTPAGVTHWASHGMEAGTFDIFICAFGRAVWLDVKTGSARLTDEQRRFQAHIREANGVAEVVRSVDEALEMVEWVLSLVEG